MRLSGLMSYPKLNTSTVSQASGDSASELHNSRDWSPTHSAGKHLAGVRGCTWVLELSFTCVTMGESFNLVVSNRFHTRDQFRGRHFIMDWGCGGMILRDSSTLHLLCTLLLLYQLHLRSSGIRSWIGHPGSSL